VQTRLDGDTLVLLVEGMSDGAQDSDLPDLLRGAVPAGTPIVVNRVPGSRSSAGKVSG